MAETLSPTASVACGYVTEWQSGARIIKTALLDGMANRFLRDIDTHSATIDRFSRRSGSPLALALKGYRVAFASTGKDNCVDVDPTVCKITVNRDFFDGIADRAIHSDWPRNVREGVVVRRIVRVNTRAIVRMVVGHELFHTEQGLPTIDVLRHAVATVGWDEVARLDVDADFRAAAIEAALSAIEDGDISYAQVLRRFEDALAFQLRYCAPIFGSPQDKPHKRSRVAAIAMQLARIVHALRMRQSIDAVAFASLTMPLFVKFDAKYSRIAVIGLDPMIYLGSAEFEVGELKEFFDALDSGRVEWLVREAITLWMRMGLLPA
jgi:hypothetical protein